MSTIFYLFFKILLNLQKILNNLFSLKHFISIIHLNNHCNKLLNEADVYILTLAKHPLDSHTVDYTFLFYCKKINILLLYRHLLMLSCSYQYDLMVRYDNRLNKS